MLPHPGPVRRYGRHLERRPTGSLSRHDARPHDQHRPNRRSCGVRFGGRLLATTDRAMKLDETGLPSRYYLPPDDVQTDLLRPTTFHTNCPFKGEASYWSLDINGEIHDGIVWSYETPTTQAAEVRGMMSFYPDRTEVTVDGQSLRD